MSASSYVLLFHEDSGHRTYCIVCAIPWAHMEYTSIDRLRAVTAGDFFIVHTQYVVVLNIG